MKVLLQRAANGTVSINGKIAGSIGPGLVVLVGVRKGDAKQDAEILAGKTCRLRIFSDREGRMNQSVQDIQGEVLAISQFTLYADTQKGNRPGFTRAAEPGVAEACYNAYVDELRRVLGDCRVATGRFGASMQVELLNDGPVTVELNTDE